MTRTGTQPDAGPYRILIATGDPEVARQLALLMQAPQRSIEVCETLREASDLLRDNPVDLVLVGRDQTGPALTKMLDAIKTACPGADVMACDSAWIDRRVKHDDEIAAWAVPKHPRRFGEVLRLENCCVEL